MGKNNRKRRIEKQRKRVRARKVLNRKKKDIRNELSGPFVRKIESPLAGLSEDEHQQAMLQISENAEKIYTESLLKITEILRNYDPAILLSILVSYGLMFTAGKDGVQTKDADLKIHQSHIEICQAFALQIKSESIERQPPGSNSVQELWDALKLLMEADSYRSIAHSSDMVSEEEKAIYFLQNTIRDNTRIVRNWGFFSQVKEISLELYSHFDAPLIEAYGFGCSNIINLFLLLLDEVETASSNRFQTISKLSKLPNSKELVYGYHDLIGESRVEAEKFLSNNDVSALPIKSLFLLLLSHYDLRLNKNYEFSPRSLSYKLDVEESTVRTMLDEFSYSWGSLESFDIEKIFLSNPIWLRPIIKVDEDKYFCCLPQMFFSFVIPSLERLVENVGKPALSRRRATYLEDKIVEIVNRRFPSANTVSKLRWKDKGVEYETDSITFIDSQAIIIEAKSGKITGPALRGAPDRIRKHIDEILVSPNLQSKRLKEKLEELIATPHLADDLRSKLPVDLEKIHNIIRVSISLEYFGSIQSNVAQLKETGWLPIDFEPCPTISVADLEILFDILDHPVQIIHYLERRQELEATVGYMGDELDLMGLYVDTLFNLGDMQPNQDMIITGMSSRLDKYYLSKEADIDIPKPKPKLSILFLGIVKQLENRRTPRWTEIGVILYRFPPDDQRKITRMIEKLKKNVRRNWKKIGHKNMVIVVPPKASKYALCYIVYNDNNEDKRREFIQAAAKHGLESGHVKQCLIIAKNMDREDLHYNFIGLFE
ncbi:hypothetical protein ACFL17_04270 [Pseudomonadota bacterium]